MSEIKLTIDGTDYELLEVDWMPQTTPFDWHTPMIKLGGKVMIGKAIPKEKNIPKDKPDWEIVSLINTSQHIIFKKWGNNRFSEKEHTYGYPLDELIRLPHFTIHSVKRLSDAEVFSIDTVVDGGEIYAFEIAGWEMIAIFKNNYGFCNINFLSIIKPKVPLFTTEDLQPVFIHQKVWYVNGIFKIDTHDFDKQDEPFYPDLYKYFSSEEKAKQWVIENKPVLLSYDDLCRYSIKADWVAIRNIFKSKIKL